MTLGEEVILVALDPQKGRLRGTEVLVHGLNAAELVELMAAGRVAIRTDDGPPHVAYVHGEVEALTEDLLNRALDQIVSDRRPTQPSTWIRTKRHLLVERYLRRLRERGVLKWDAPADPKALFGRIHVVRPDAVAEATGRIDRVVEGVSPSERDLDLAAIVHGIGLDTEIHRGRRNRSRQADLAAAVEKHRLTILIGRSLPRPVSNLDIRAQGGNQVAEDYWWADGGM